MNTGALIIIPALHLKRPEEATDGIRLSSYNVILTSDSESLTGHPSPNVSSLSRSQVAGSWFQLVSQSLTGRPTT